MRRLLALTACSLVAVAGHSTAAPTTLCSLQDDRLTESSGLAVLSDGSLVTHNDSGDAARFFVLDRRCRTTAVHTLSADASDWEDMARGGGALWFGDIGDNAMTRADVVVQRVAERSLRRKGGAVPATAYRLVYPDGAHDAETLLAHPRTGRLFVVTKAYTGTSLVYAAPEVLSATAPNALVRVGQFQVLPSGTTGGPIGPVGQLSTTGGDISPRLDRVVVRTYTDAYEWTVSGGDVAGAFAASPRRTPLPETTQGEAIAYDRDGTTLLTTSEGAGAPVHRLTR